jgi:exodeoxyribonuclease VII small subunit
MSTNAAETISNLSFEEGLRELEQIVKRLENGEATLEQSITDYTRGTALKAHCEARLKDAELKVRQLSQNPDGSITDKPFEAE